MLIVIPDLIDAAGVAHIRALIDAAQWVDGNVTSGHQSALAKRNLQLPESAPEARQAGQMILDALGHPRPRRHTRRDRGLRAPRRHRW